jgi:hypothetical protein
VDRPERPVAVGSDLPPVPLGRRLEICHGPEAVAGDEFGMGPLLDTGVLLLGRKTWEIFAVVLTRPRQWQEVLVVRPSEQCPAAASWFGAGDSPC